MTAQQIRNNISYLYLKTELKKLADEYKLTDEQIRLAENILKENIEATKELCWL